VDSISGLNDQCFMSVYKLVWKPFEYVETNREHRNNPKLFKNKIIFRRANLNCGVFDAVKN